MKRWLPAPLLSAALFVTWLVLNRSTGPSDVLIGALLALAVPLLTVPLRPPGGPLRSPVVLARLILTVGGDVVLSALQVARGVLRSGRQVPNGRFVVVPLELRDVHGLAALSMITSVIPGTVWSELAPDRSTLRLHIFDLPDEAAFVAHYKARYERPLLEIFG